MDERFALCVVCLDRSPIGGPVHDRAATRLRLEPFSLDDLGNAIVHFHLAIPPIEDLVVAVENVVHVAPLQMEVGDVLAVDLPGVGHVAAEQTVVTVAAIEDLVAPVELVFTDSHSRKHTYQRHHRKDRRVSHDCSPTARIWFLTICLVIQTGPTPGHFILVDVTDSHCQIAKNHRLLTVSHSPGVISPGRKSKRAIVGDRPFD